MNKHWKFLLILMLTFACDIHPTSAGASASSQVPEIVNTRMPETRSKPGIFVYSNTQQYYFN